MPFPLRPAVFTFLLASLLATRLLSAGPAAVHPVRDPEGSRSLNGVWKFRYTAGAVPAGSQPVEPGSDPANWAEIPVPSNWELHGFAEPHYGTTAEGYGDYLRKFEVPAEWEGQRIFLHFDGALYALEAWVNGRRVGDWASSFNPVAFDVTDALQAGTNTLVVRVSTRTKGWDFDLNDCWGLSGLFRDVTLFAAPPVHLKEYTSETKLLPDQSAKLRLHATLSGPGRVTGRLFASDSSPVAEFAFAPDGTGGLTAQLMVSQPRLWTAETPHLYRLELQVEAPGQSLQRVSERIGLREVGIRDGVLQLNGRPIKLRGVNHHDLWPDTGRATDEARIRRDLELARDGNCNFIRTSHYPPHPRLIELCDEMGFYVMDEVPFGYGDSQLTDPSFQEVLNTRARATLRRDRNRPSVIIWSVGNENPNTPLTFATGRLVKELDPSRPICFPQVGPYFTQSYREIPDWVDIYAPHYPDMATLRRYAQELNRPVIISEYAHGMGTQVDRIQDEWALMEAYPRLAGGALWMLQDQGLLRTAATPVDRSERTRFVWRDATHYYDTNQNDGMDGMVYSDRTPQPDYWMMRAAYAPIRIFPAPRTRMVAGEPFLLQVENRHDFISLTGARLEWAYERNGGVLQRGEIALTAAARSSEQLRVTPTVPKGRVGDIDLLVVRAIAPDGRTVSDHTLPLQSDLPVDRVRQFTADLPASPLVVSRETSVTEIRHPLFTLAVDTTKGALALRGSDGHLIAEGLFAHVGRKFTESELLRLKNKWPMWSGSAIAPEQPRVSIEESDRMVRVVVSGRFTDPSAASRVLVGGYRWEIGDTGVIRVEYDFEPMRGTGGMLLEAGAALRLPGSVTEFRWLGDGPFPGYPGADNLNAYGLHHLSRADIRFSGNRRRTEAAIFTAPAGAGLLLIPSQSADLAVERAGEGLTVSHNALLSGRGTKQFGAPETLIRVEETPAIRGDFTLVPLSVDWPAGLRRIFGEPAQAASEIQQPFYHSYEQ
ncbi:MAG: glycoside hydrolase family 2 TIM barrel-domain containing protein [Verrucomicrobiota bacterium]